MYFDCIYFAAMPYSVSIESTKTVSSLATPRLGFHLSTLGEEEACVR